MNNEPGSKFRFAEWLPGRVDGSVILLLTVALALAIAAWIPAYVADSVAVWPGIALCAALIFLLSCSAHFHLWYMLSDRSILFRVLAAIFVNGIALLLYEFALAFVAQSAEVVPSEFVYEHFVAFGLQRFVIVFAVTILGSFVRSATQWRIILQHESLDARPRKRPMSIASIMLFTSLVAITLVFRGSVKDWLGVGVDLAVGSTNTGFLEAREIVLWGSIIDLVAFAFVLIPTSVSLRFGNRARIGRAVFGMCLVIVGFILMVRIAFSGAEQAMIRAIGFTALAAVVIALLFASVTSFAEACGFQMAHVSRDELWTPIAPRLKRFGWTGWTSSALLLVIVVVGSRSWALPVLIQQGSFARAAAAKRVTRELGVRYSGINRHWHVIASDVRDSVSLHDDEAFRLSIVGDSNPEVLLKNVASDGVFGYLSVKKPAGIVGRAELSAIQSLKELGRLEIVGEFVAADALKELVESKTQVNSLRLSVREKIPEELVLAVAGEFPSFVTFFSSAHESVPLTVRTAPILQAKSIRYLTASYPDPSVPEFDKIQNCLLYTSDAADE